MQFHIPSVLQAEPAARAPAPEEPVELGVAGAVPLEVAVWKTPGATEVGEGTEVTEAKVIVDVTVVTVDKVVVGSAAAIVDGLAALVVVGLLPDPPDGAAPPDPPIPFTAAQVPV